MIETEYLFCNICIQMERFDRNVGSVQSALEARPEVLDSVGVDVFADRAVDVVDNLMEVRASNKWVSGMLIGDDVRASFDGVVKGGSHGVSLAVCDHASANLAAALQHSHNDGLAVASGV